MASELIWQRKICESARNQGGYGKKWNTDVLIGVPDLILVVPTHGTVFMEVKKHPAKGDYAAAPVNTTKRQRHELALINEAGGFARVGLIMEHKKNEHRLYLVDPVNTTMEVARDPSVLWEPGFGFNLIKLLDAYKGRKYAGPKNKDWKQETVSSIHPPHSHP